MPKLDFDALLKESINAVKGPLSEKWPEIKDIAATECKKFANLISYPGIKSIDNFLQVKIKNKSPSGDLGAEESTG